MSLHIETKTHVLTISNWWVLFAIVSAYCLGMYVGAN